MPRDKRSAHVAAGPRVRKAAAVAHPPDERAAHHPDPHSEPHDTPSNSLEMLFEQCAIGLVEIGLDERVQRVNAHGRALLGCDEARSHTLTLSDIVSPEDHPALRERLARLRDGDQRAEPFRARLRACDGRVRPVEMTVAVLRDAEDAAQGYAATLSLVNDAAQASAPPAHAAALTDQRLLALRAVTDVTLATLPLEQLLTALLDRILTTLNADAGAVLLLTPDGEHLQVHATRGLERGRAESVQVPLGRGFAGTIAQQGAPWAVDDLSAIEVCSPFLRQRVRSAVGVPLRAEDRVLGVLYVGTTHPRHFTEQDIELLQVAAERVSSATTNAQRLAEIDASRAYLRATFEVLPVGVSLASADGRMLEVNAAFRKIWGLSAPLAEGVPQYALYRAWWAASGKPLGADDWAMTRALRTGEVSTGEELDIETFDGQRRTILHTGAPVRDASGQIIGGVTAMMDISERKALERQRDVQARQLATILETVPDVLFVFDAAGRAQHINAAGRDLLARLGSPLGNFDVPLAARVEQARSPVLCTLAGDPLPVEQWPMARALRGEHRAGADAVDYLLPLPDGTSCQMSASLAPLRDDAGQISGALVLGRDVTEQRRLEHETTAALAQVRAQRDYLHTLVDANIIGILLADEDRLYEANDAFLAMVGYTPEDLAAGAIPWREMTPREHMPKDRQARQELLTSGECTPYETEYWRKDGSRVPILLGAAVVTRDPLRWVGFVLDLSARVALESRLREANSQLTLTSLQAQEHARELSEERAKHEAFVALIAHDLGQPLTALKANAQLLQRRPGLDDKTARVLTTISQQVRRLERLTHDLLDVSRLAAGTFSIQPGPTDLLAVIHQVIREFEPTVTGHALALHAPESPIRGAWDQQRLSQVLANLVSNAIKYSPHGGEIEITVQHSLDMAVVAVRDHGTGLSETDMAKLFQPYSRLYHVRQAEGTGLGLVITKGIVEAHGGTIEVASPGRGYGCTFTVRLPLPAAGSTQATGASETTAAHSHQAPTE